MKSFLVRNFVTFASLLGAFANAIAADTADVQDIIVLTPARPLVIRLHIQFAGQAYQSIWGDYLWERFNELDRNGDGALENDEFVRGDWEVNFNLRRDGAGRSMTDSLNFLDVDVDPRDDVVSFSEFAAKLADRCLSFSVSTIDQTNRTQDLLLTRLDGNGDGRLAKAEITQGLAGIYRFDRNEDELLTTLELRADGNPFADRNNFRVGNNTLNQQNQSVALAPVPDTMLDATVAVILQFYDRLDKPPSEPAPAGTSEQQLTPQELRLPDEQFKLADADANGNLNAGELLAWLKSHAPDADLIIELAAGTSSKNRIRPLTTEPPAGAATNPAAPNVQVVDSKTEESQVVVRLPNTEIAINAKGPARFSAQRANYETLFKRGDADNNGYLDAMEAVRVGRGRSQFKSMDADHNGMVFLEEFLKFQEHQLAISARRVSASVSDQGSRLLEIVDANSNGNLSTREMRAVTKLLGEWDANADGDVAAEELPRRYTIQIAPGSGNTDGNLVFPQAIVAGMARTMELPGKGPEWFERMDRNRDGDLSRREFLGKRAEFNKLDADHDGLIDANEARSAK